MAGQSSAMIGWSWTDVSVLGSQVFGQALMDSCDFRARIQQQIRFSYFFKIYSSMWLLFQRSIAPWWPLLRKKNNCRTVPLIMGYLIKLSHSGCGCFCGSWDLFFLIVYFYYFYYKTIFSSEHLDDFFCNPVYCA